MTARGRLVGVAMVVCAIVAGCGGGQATGSRISGTPVGQAGFTTYRGAGYELSVPSAQRAFVTQSATGRISAAWSTPGTGNFVILATSDPHPVSFATAVATATSASQTAFHATKHAVVTARVPGARAAKLITASGPHGTGYYSGLPQRDANLLVSTRSGATIDVLVVSHGAGNPDPMTMIDSFRLTS
jgi:hypothetical protein